MSNVILADNGVSSGTSGIKTTGDTSGQLALQTTTSGGTATTALTIDNNQNTTLAGYLNTPNTFGFKNRIINGAMMIDQRDNGASVTLVGSTNTYIVDRWYAYGSQASKLTIQQNAGSVTPPAGFSNYLGFTSSSAYSVGSSDIFYTGQKIEGFNIVDLGWGTSNAKTVTLSFWVYSSLTGTFGGSILNGTYNYTYPFTYTVSSANTWTQISITVSGPTAGTWATGNGTGILVSFQLGMGSGYTGPSGSWSANSYYGANGCVSVVGTNGATFYITGVQLEKGTTATSFDYRPFGIEFSLCQRYFETNFGYGTAPANAGATVDTNVITAYSTTNARYTFSFATQKRVTPTLTYYSGTNNHTTNGLWAWYNGSWVQFTSNTASAYNNAYQVGIELLGSFTTFNSYLMQGGWTASAEL
jgi:hypothetical protein